MKRVTIGAAWRGAICFLMIGALGFAATQQAQAKKKPMKRKKTVRTSGSAESIKFAVAWSDEAEAGKAGRQATQKAIKALGCPAKAVIFYTYYQDADFVQFEQQRHERQQLIRCEGAQVVSTAQDYQDSKLAEHVEHRDGYTD